MLLLLPSPPFYTIKIYLWTRLNIRGQRDESWGNKWEDNSHPCVSLTQMGHARKRRAGGESCSRIRDTPCRVDNAEWIRHDGSVHLVSTVSHRLRRLFPGLLYKRHSSSYNTTGRRTAKFTLGFLKIVFASNPALCYSSYHAVHLSTSSSDNKLFKWNGRLAIASPSWNITAALLYNEVTETPRVLFFCIIKSAIRVVIIKRTR